MPTAEEHTDPPRRNFAESLEKYLALIPLAGAAVGYLAKLSLFWILLLVVSSAPISIILILRARKRRKRRLNIQEPDELRLKREDFRGRDDDVARITERIPEQQILCLTGDSGCGKTTLVDWGLLENKDLTDRFETVKIEAYGLDWITGPLLEILTRLALKRTPKDAPSRLGLETSHLITRLEEELKPSSKPVLIIFDQFDHYLSAFHALLYSNGEPISREELRLSNPFWDCVLRLAEQRAIHCLFVIETRQHWLAQPFLVGGKLYRLDSLKRGYARGLLNKLLRRAGSPTSDSEVEELIERVSEDLERTDLLPVELDFTLRSLPYLKPLSARGYRGLPGLIALGVGGEIRDVVKGRQISYQEVLVLLLELISKEEGKPRAKPIADLVLPADGGRAPAILEAVLEALESRRITKSQPDPAGLPRWTLYHEFLVRVLVALHEEAQQQESELRVSLDRYRRASSLPEKIRALLAPWTAFRLLLARVHGHVRLDGAMGLMFASLSFWPGLVVFGMLLMYGIYYRTDAQRTGIQIVTRLNSQEGLQEEDDVAIWLLHGSPPLAQRIALERFLDSETNAGRFFTHADLILHSVIGLQPEKMMSVLEPVWRDRCLNEWQNLGSSRLRACALMENELPQSDLRTWERYLTASIPEEVLVSLFAKLQPSDQATALVLLKQAIDSQLIYSSGRLAAALLQRASPEEIASRGYEILASLAAQEGLRGLHALQDFWRSLSGGPARHLKEDTTILMNEKIRATSTELEGDDLLQWAILAKELLASGWKPDAGVTAKAKEVLLGALQEKHEGWDKLQVLHHLGAFQRELTAAEVDFAKVTFLTDLETCRDEGTGREMHGLWELTTASWLIEFLNENETTEVFDYLSRFSSVNTGLPQKEAVQIFRRDSKRLAARLGLSIRLQLIDRYQKRLRGAADIQSADSLFVLLGSLISSEPTMLPRQDELVTELLRVVKHEDHLSTRSLSYIVRIWWPDLQPRVRQRIEDLLQSLFRRGITTSGWLYDLDELADLLDDLDIYLPPEESQQQLARLLQRSVLPCEALAPLVRQETLDLLVGQGFRYPVCPLGISPSVAEKLEKLNLLKIEEVGQRVGEARVLDRGRVAAWVRGKGYDLDGPLLFRGVLY